MSNTTHDELNSLGVKIVSKRTKKLMEVKEKCEEDLLNGEIEKLISERIVSMLEEEIKKENKKLK
jgi:hypothetical protein